MVKIYGTYAKHQRNITCCCILTYGDAVKSIAYTYSPELTPHWCLISTFRHALNKINRPCKVELLSDCKRAVAGFSEIAQEIDRITPIVQNDYAPNKLKKAFWTATDRMKSFVFTQCKKDHPYIQQGLLETRKHANEKPVIVALT